MFLWTGHFDHEKGESAEEHCIQHETKLTPLPTDKFKAVPSLNRELSDAVSFKYIKRNGWYITCKNRLCHIEPKRRTMTFGRKLIVVVFPGEEVLEKRFYTGQKISKK